MTGNDTSQDSRFREEWSVWWHRTDDRGKDLPEGKYDSPTGWGEASARALYEQLRDDPAVHAVRLMRRWIETGPWEELGSRA